MRRQIASLLLTLVLLAASCPANAAFAASAGRFADVAADAWYYEYVDSLCRLGLLRGQGAEDRFDPDGQVTVAQAVTLAARLRSLLDWGDGETGPGQYGGELWYQPYLAYLQAQGALGDELAGTYDLPATRAQTAHVLAAAMAGREPEERNAQAVAVGYASRQRITDVTDATPYREDVLRLYRWGILDGADGTGSFLPQATLRRSELSAMAARLADPSLRLSLEWDQLAYSSRAGATLAGLIHSDGSFHAAPDPADPTAIDENLRYMLARGERQMRLDYGPGNLDRETVRSLLEANVQGVRQYLEQGYNEVKCEYSLQTGQVTMTFSSSLGDSRLTETYREAALQEAVAVHDRLWEEGLLHAGMTEYERARVYFTWLCVHCDYDYNSDETSLSHSGYGALVNALAVCDGYTAAYNLFLKLEGIQCATRSTNSHIWSVAVLDGTTYHIDPTWGDQPSGVAYRYFGMTEAASLARFG